MLGFRRGFSWDRRICGFLSWEGKRGIKWGREKGEGDIRPFCGERVGPDFVEILEVGLGDFAEREVGCFHFLKIIGEWSGKFSRLDEGLF
jgi:hypothetical protein